MSEVDSFSCRGESYKEGMLLLLGSLTEEEWKLASIFSARLLSIKLRIENLYKDYLDEIKKATTFEAKKNHLSALLKAYSHILLTHTRLNDCFQSLCIAERCAVWQKGRKAFSNVTTIAKTRENGQALEIVQTETPYTDSELLSEEFSAMSEAVWFKLLAPWQQKFILSHENELVSRSIPSSLRCVPGLANLSEHQCKVNGHTLLSYFRHATQSPVELLKDKSTGVENEQFRLVCLNVASQIRLSLDQQLERAGGKILHEAVILSQSILSPGLAADTKSYFFTDPSDNDTQIYEAKEQVVELFQKAIAYPNAKMSSEDSSNVKALLFRQHKPTKALYYRDFLAKFALLAQPDGTFEYKAHLINKITLLSTNHPFNILRRLGVYSPQTKRNAVNTAQLLAAVARYLQNQFSLIEEDRATKALFSTELFDDKNKLLVELAPYERGARILTKKAKEMLIKSLKQLQNSIELRKLMRLFDRNRHNEKSLENRVRLFNESAENMFRLLDAVQVLVSTPATQGVLTSDRRHYQQLISAAEATILHCIGGTLWVACKSGKDRTGGASVAYDAAAAFYAQRGRHPRYEDTKADRALYLSLLTACYESEHQKIFAAQSAPGAKGLLGAGLFLPDDMRLEAKKVQQETQLARLNKPKLTISKKSLDIFNKQLLEDTLQVLKDKIINNKLGDSATLEDWPRNVNSYFINGISISELQGSEGFKRNEKEENKKILLNLIGKHLLFSIEDQELKQYYQALILYSFHQGGFPHVFGYLNSDINEQFKEEKECSFSREGKEDSNQAVKVNFSCSENMIHIEEINTYNKMMDKCSNIILAGHGGYYYQTHSSISVALRKAKDKGYELTTVINRVSVDLAYEGKQLRPFFFKNSSLFQRILDFFTLLSQAIKQYFYRDFHRTDKNLDENWLNKINRSKMEEKIEKSNFQPPNGLVSELSKSLPIIGKEGLSESSNISSSVDSSVNKASFFSKLPLCSSEKLKKGTEKKQLEEPYRRDVLLRP